MSFGCASLSSFPWSLLAARQATSAAAGGSAGRSVGSSSHPVPLQTVALEDMLRSFTLLACAGTAASPDPSAMMIQFLQLQGDSCVMCLCSLGSCWFSEQNQVSEVRPAAFVGADGRKRAEPWNCCSGHSDLPQLCH